MFTTKTIYGCLVLILAIPSVANAQQSSQAYELPPVRYQPVSPWPPHMGESYHHDSTVAGNYFRGQAGLVYANGNYWVSVSQAAILFEYARSLDNCNRKQWIELRAWNRKRLQAERQQSLSAKRVKHEAVRQTTYKAAYGLTEDELDRESGQITWPIALHAPEYDGLRSRLNELFSTVACGDHQFTPRADEIAVCADNLARVLGRNIKTIERSDYLAAQKFLCGLKYEPEFSKPAVTNPTASYESSKLGMN